MKQFQDEKLFKFILSCARNHNKPDLHSFTIELKSGKAFVKCDCYGVHITEFSFDENSNEKITQWEGTAIAATNRLEMLGAKYETMDM